MKRKSFRPKKSLGQNFLYDPAIAARILDAAALKSGDTVVELGAGKGILTRALAARGVQLIAIELDPPLFDELAQHFREATERPPGPEPELINDDLTKVKLGELLSERGIDSCILFGNIPYYLTRDVLFGYLVDHHHCIEAAYIMMQKEVADRIVSPPGSRVYGITSVILQALYDVRMVMKVAPGSFQPRPRVSSAVLEFRVLEEKLVEEHELRPFVNLVKNLFQQRRKKISSTLRSFYGLGPDELNALHAATDIDMRSRPESLSRDQFIELMRQMPEVSSK